MSEPHPTATFRRVWQETPRLTGVVLEVERALADQYTRPGQVVILRPNEQEKVYLALASSPGEAHGLELLLGPEAVAKLQPVEGGTIRIDPPFGNGFSLEMAHGKDVFLFAVGSGLAPIRPLIEHLRRNRSDYGKVVLYVGAHTEEDFPYRGQFEAWKRDRIDVVRSVSRPWVQARFEEEAPTVVDAVAFVVGMKAMVEEVTAALLKAGMPKERIGKNW